MFCFHFRCVHIPLLHEHPFGRFPFFFSSHLKRRNCASSSVSEMNFMRRSQRVHGVVKIDVPGSINSLYFHTIGDGHQPKSVGVYIPIIRIPIKGGMSLSPKKRDFWPWHRSKRWRFVSCHDKPTMHGSGGLASHGPSFTGEKTRPKTNIFAPQNGWLEYDCFLLERPICRGELLVSRSIILYEYHVCKLLLLMLQCFSQSLASWI